MQRKAQLGNDLVAIAETTLRNVNSEKKKENFTLAGTWNNYLYHSTIIHAISTNDVWFAAQDVCTVLGYTDLLTALGRLDEDEQGHEGNVVTINEAGVYHLLYSDYTAEAQAFRFWLTHEALPLIHAQDILANGIIKELDHIKEWEVDPSTNFIVSSLAKQLHTDFSKHEAELRRMWAKTRGRRPADTEAIQAYLKQAVNSLDILNTKLERQDEMYYELNLWFSEQHQMFNKLKPFLEPTPSK